MLLSPIGWILIGIAGGLVVMGNLLMNRLSKVDT
jgi:Flp pilus assembly protein TadB